MGRRQRYAFTSGRTCIAMAEEIGSLIGHFSADREQLTCGTDRTAAENLPEGAKCAREIRVIAGTASGGFTDETGVYVGIATLGALGAERALWEQLPAHEIWHSGHWSWIERHPPVRALGQLRSARAS